MRGDRVEVVVDIGDGVRAFEIEATRDGRRLEVSTARGQIEVAELTRSGKVIRTARFIAARVVAIVEYPAAEADGGELRPRRRRTAPENQESLGI